MDGFNGQEIGLFTFYREQAEREKQIQQQKKLKARIRKQRELAKSLQKQRKDQQQKHRRNQLKLELQKYKQKTSIKKDYEQKAKQYIKDLQMYGPYRAKLINNNKQCMEQKLINHKSYSVDISSQQFDTAFRPKKQNFSRIQYYYFDRMAIPPKDFGNLDKIIEQTKQRQKQKQYKFKKTKKGYEKTHSLVLRKKQKLLPNINKKQQIDHHNTSNASVRQIYNPKSIIQNNQKYFGKQKSRKSHQPIQLKRSVQFKKNRYTSDQKNCANESLINLLKKYPILQ